MGLTKAVRRLREKFKFNNSGMTLVELIATFALISIFMVAATNIIFKTMSIYYQARGTSYGMQVSEILASKIVGMVEGAQVVNSLEDTDDVANVTMTAENAAVLIKQGAEENRLDSIDLVDATGSRVRIGTKQNDDRAYLCIHYYPVISGGDVIYKAVDWEFDEKTYLDYSIKSLTFEKPEGFPENIIKLKLTVVSDKYGEYSTAKYIELYNFEQKDYSKIQ
jgi:hypothetical protein